MEAVKFILNGKSVYFEESIENCVLLLTDDEYTIDYIGRAARSNNLTAYGIDENSLYNLQIIRDENQPHAPEASRKASNQKNIEDINTSEKSQEFSSLSSPVIAEEYLTAPSCEIVWQPNKKTCRDNEATLLLLQIRNRAEYKKWFNDKKHSKASLWAKIAKELEKAGFKISSKGEKDAAGRVRQKFANLQKSFTGFMDNMRRTGAESIPKPPYFDLLFEILGEKDKANPPILVDSFNNTSTETCVQNSDKPKDKPLPDSLQPSTSNSNIIGTPKSTDRNKPLSDSLQASTSNSNIIGTPKTTDQKRNRFETTKSSVRPKKDLISVIENIHLQQMEELKNVKSIVTENMEKNNKHLEKECEQRDQLISILKELCTSNKKSKKRRRSSSSSD